MVETTVVWSASQLVVVTVKLWGDWRDRETYNYTCKYS